MTKNITYYPTQIGFSLIEMAIVLLIVALLLGGLLPTVSGQMEVQHRKDTRKQLDEIQQALYGFAIVNGRLPCAAKATISTTDTVNNPGMEDCVTPTSTGVIPWATLGISETDAWGRRFTYTATSLFITSPFALTTNGTLTIRSAAGANIIASNIPAVIVSHGSNGYGAYTSQGIQITPSSDLDEAENSSINSIFVSHDFTPTFDDMVVWISPNILFNRMVTAGKLP